MAGGGGGTAAVAEAEAEFAAAAAEIGIGVMPWITARAQMAIPAFEMDPQWRRLQQALRLGHGRERRRTSALSGRSRAAAQALAGGEYHHIAEMVGRRGGLNAVPSDVQGASGSRDSESESDSDEEGVGDGDDPSGGTDYERQQAKAATAVLPHVALGLPLPLPLSPRSKSIATRRQRAAAGAQHAEVHKAFQCSETWDTRAFGGDVVVPAVLLELLLSRTADGRRPAQVHPHPTPPPLTGTAVP